MRQPAYAFLVTITLWTGITVIPCDSSAQRSRRCPLLQTFSGSQSMRGAFDAGQTIGAATTQLKAAFATHSIGRHR
jgi:hypothetical protein